MRKASRSRIWCCSRESVRGFPLGVRWEGAWRRGSRRASGVECLAKSVRFRVPSVPKFSNRWQRAQPADWKSWLPFWKDRWPSRPTESTPPKSAGVQRGDLEGGGGEAGRGGAASVEAAGLRRQRPERSAANGIRRDAMTRRMWSDLNGFCLFSLRKKRVGRACLCRTGCRNAGGWR
jgi:hypothetical protein